ncbi:unnamed protein product [Discosporangium mesarthrocarpum]
MIPFPMSHGISHKMTGKRRGPIVSRCPWGIGILSIFLACSCASRGALAFASGLGTSMLQQRGGYHMAARSGGSFAGAPVMRTSKEQWWSGRGRGRRSGQCVGPVMLFGVGETILGVGTPEAVVVLVVGYFVLGPVELFKLAKQAGLIVGQLRDLGLGTVQNLGTIMDEQIMRADAIEQGRIPPPGPNDGDTQGPVEGEDLYEDVLVDEFGRVVSDESNLPRALDEDKPFFEGWTPPQVPGLNTEDEDVPLPKMSKFAEQISGAVNKKVLESSGGAGKAAVDAAGTASPLNSAVVESAMGMGAGAGMAGVRAPFTPARGEGEALTKDVPPELSIEEQFERLDAIADVEQERALTMERLEARLDARINSIKSELLAMVDEDFKIRRERVDQKFWTKAQDKAALDAAPQPGGAGLGLGQGPGQREGE